jgi:thiosulfate/3-mercaptopyruvate sulfurtransferase
MVFVLALLLTAPLTPRTDLLVSTGWLARHMNDVAVVHVARQRAEYDEGHIPGARLLLFDEIVVERAGVANELRPAEELEKTLGRLGISRQTRIVLYGDILAASRAFFTLDYLGHERKAMLDGGLAKWRAENRPVSIDVPRYEAATYRSAPRPELVVTLDRMRDLSHVAPQGDVALIDSRPAAISSKGRIPGSKNVFWMDGLASRENPVLKPAAELGRLYGLPKSPRIVVTYCQSGVQASQSYFTLRYLGYPDVRMYDGSFGEWSKNPDLPVAH